LKIQLQDGFATAVADLGIQSKRKKGVFRSSFHPPMLLDVARCRTLKGGQLRWEIRYPLRGTEGLHCIALRLKTDGKLPLHYLLFRRLPPGHQWHQFGEEQIQQLASIHGSLEEAISLFLRRDNPARE
jgi:hypothetical protein